MGRKSGLLLVAMLLSASVVFSQKFEASPYELYLKIDPVSGTISCKSEIINPSDSCFYLTKGMKITKIYSDGKKAIFHQRVSPVVENSDIITVEGNIPHNLVIEYSGQIIPETYPNNINSINMVREGLVELSDHIKWFPVIRNLKSFLYKVNLDLPADYEPVTNLVLKKKSIDKGRSLTKWESSDPSYSITLIAAQGFKMRSISRDGMTLEMYFKNLPVTYIDSMKSKLMNSMELLTALYGSPGSKNMVRIIYSPRGAGGYARAPLILVSENFALEQRSLKFGPARDFRLNTHEIAHYWSKAKTDTPDDWINEGLAEYSALWVSDKLIGKEFSKILLNEYNEIVGSSKPVSAIADTPGNSGDREVNRYYKPTLMFNDLYEKYGEEKLKLFLKTLYARFSQTGIATTSVFLNVMEQVYDKETKDYFSGMLYRKPDGDDNAGPYIPFTLSDTAFIGKWSGPLTQFGSTVKFVLNIDVKEGNIIPTLDSPDQNVTGIPVTDLKITHDSVLFKIGVASASYRGSLDRKAGKIIGEFKQRGSVYILNLSK